MNAIMTFAASIYPPERIDATVQAFEKWATCDVRKRGDLIDVELVPREEGDVAVLLRHFANYALAASLESQLETET